MAQTIEDKDVEVLDPREKGWLRLIKFQGPKAGFPWEFVERRNGNFSAVKVLPIFLDPDVPPPVNAPLYGEETLSFMKGIRLSKFFIFTLAAERPITYRSPQMFLRENFVRELPGGVVESDETTQRAVVRELVEESGVNIEVCGVMPLIYPPCAWDGGTHNEWYSIWAVLATGKPNPPRKEGIIPEECRLTQLLQAENWLEKERVLGVAVEGYVLSALHALRVKLFGRWIE